MSIYAIVDGYIWSLMTINKFPTLVLCSSQVKVKININISIQDIGVAYGLFLNIPCTCGIYGVVNISP